MFLIERAGLLFLWLFLLHNCNKLTLTLRTEGFAVEPVRGDEA